MPAYTYILKCSDNSYYTGSTRNIVERFNQHQSGKGSRHTHNKLPVELVSLEEYSRIGEAFYREKQIQGWSRKKKEALMQGDWKRLHDLAICKNISTSLSNRASAALSKDTSSNEK